MRRSALICFLTLVGASAASAKSPGVAPAFYRFKVTFRWSGAGGQVIGRAVRFSPVCFQPELRPDLRVASITPVPTPGNPAQETFIAEIRNGGKTAAPQFDVSFSDAGT